MRRVCVIVIVLFRETTDTNRRGCKLLALRLESASITALGFSVIRLHENEVLCRLLFTFIVCVCAY